MRDLHASGLARTRCIQSGTTLLADRAGDKCLGAAFAIGWRAHIEPDPGRAFLRTADFKPAARRETLAATKCIGGRAAVRAAVGGNGTEFTTGDNARHWDSRNGPSRILRKALDCVAGGTARCAAERVE